MALPAIFRVVALQPDDPFYPPGFFDASVAWQVAWLYATGRMLTPYWFIPMIAIVFVLAPAFVAVDRRPWLYWSILPLTALAMMVHRRSEEHTSELQSLMRISYAVFCLKKKKNTHKQNIYTDLC